MSKRLNDRQRYSATEVALTLRLAKRDCDDEETMFLQLKSHKVYDLKAYLQFKDWPATGHKSQGCFDYEDHKPPWISVPYDF